jgi:hypothetical protein
MENLYVPFKLLLNVGTRAPVSGNIRLAVMLDQKGKS